MKGSYKVETVNEFVETVNRIVKESFGNSYRGNCNMIAASPDGFLVEESDLRMIAKPTFMSDPQFGCGIAGLLGCEEIPNPDGSVIVVRNSLTLRDKLFKKTPGWYERAAEKYAKLYEDTFGKEVHVHVRPLSTIMEQKQTNFHFVSR